MVNAKKKSIPSKKVFVSKKSLPAAESETVLKSAKEEGKDARFAETPMVMTNSDPSNTRTQKIKSSRGHVFDRRTLLTFEDIKQVPVPGLENHGLLAGSNRFEFGFTNREKAISKDIEKYGAEQMESQLSKKKRKAEKVEEVVTKPVKAEKKESKKESTKKESTKKESASDWFEQMKLLASGGNLLSENTELWEQEKDESEEPAEAVGSILKNPFLTGEFHAPLADDDIIPGFEHVSTQVTTKKGPAVPILPAPGYRQRIDTGYNNQHQYGDRLDFLLSVEARMKPKKIKRTITEVDPLKVKHKVLILPSTDSKTMAVRQFVDILAQKEKSQRVKTKVLVIVHGSKLTKQVGQQLGQRITIHQRNRKGMSGAGVQAFTKNTVYLYDTQPEWDAQEHLARFEIGKANVMVVSDNKTEYVLDNPNLFGVIIHFDIPTASSPYDTYKHLLTTTLRHKNCLLPTPTVNEAGETEEIVNESWILLIDTRANRAGALDISRAVEEDGQLKVADALKKFGAEKSN